MGASLSITAIRRLVRCALLCAVLVFAASCVTHATVVIVDLATDAPPTRAVTVSVAASDGTSSNVHWHALADGGPLRLPASFGVTPAPGGLDHPAVLTLDVTVSPAAPGEPQLRFNVSARFAFIPHTTTRIPLYVSIACGAPARGCTAAGVPCTVAEFCHEHGQSCSAGGRCAAVTVDPPRPDGGVMPDACVPVCADRMCGGDGCGGSCGNCAMGDTCNGLGQCVNVHCTPSCTGHNCGSDGCGGTCGTCAGTQSCSAAGQCVDGPCVPNCAGRNCGSDGCTGSCGACPGGQVCNTIGHCATACGGSCAGRVCGDDGCGNSCGACSAGNVCNAFGQCISSCIPNCSGRNCGPDGCGGSCGACLATQSCGAGGVCSGGCVPNCAGHNCGGDTCGGSCGSCGGTDVCMSGVCTAVCTPNCAGRSCGPDGCGGSCGGCPASFVCNGAGACACPSGQSVCSDGLCAPCCVTSCATATVCGCATGAEINNYCHDACGAFNESAHLIPTCANVHSVAGTDNCGGACTTDCIDDGHCTWTCVDGGPAACPPDRMMDCGTPSGAVAAGECVCD